ncbi:MAG: hypothetical protein HYU28_00745, partial [Actinobacteria bacterium]|nr:hypothetical protein [Actinomycetota bacterium]
MRATVQDRQDRVDRVEAAPVWDPRWDLPQVEAPVAAHPPRGVVWNEVLRDVRVRRIAAALFAAWMVGAGILLLVMRPAPSGERVARPATAIDPT